jgi:hypothetical protein
LEIDMVRTIGKVRTVLAGLGVLALVMAGGCQNSSPAASAPMPQKAIVVTGGNGGSVAVFEQTPDGVMALTGPGTVMCAQCKTDAEKYFKTGELVDKCSACGATRTPVTLVPYTSHN